MIEAINYEKLAAQLRRPLGNEGIDIAFKMNESNLKMTEVAINTLAFVKGESVVEIGPGNGMLSLPIFDLIGEKGKYIAIDYSKDMIKVVTDNFANKGRKNFQIIHANCQTDDIKISQTDALFGVNILYFIDDLELLSTKIKKWLKSSARIAFGVRTKEIMDKLPFTQYNFAMRSESEYLDAFKKAAFKKIEVKKYDDGFFNFNNVELKNEFFIISMQT